MGSTNSWCRAALSKIRSTLVWVLSHPVWTGIGVIAVIILGLINLTSLTKPPSPNDPPTSPGVYSLRGISAGKKLTEDLVETRGDSGSATHLHPVELEQVIGLCLTENIEKNTQLTLKHLRDCNTSCD